MISSCKWTLTYGMHRRLTIVRYRPRDYEVDEGPWDPITGSSSAVVGLFSSILMGVADLPIETLKALKIHPETVKAKIKDKKEKRAQRSNNTESSSSTAQEASGTTTTFDNVSRTSLITTPSESSTQSVQSPPTSRSSIKRKPLPLGSPLASPRSPTLSRQTSEDIPMVQSPTSIIDDPNLLTPQAPHSRSRSSAMAEALRNLPESSRPRSHSRSRSHCSHGDSSPRSTSPSGTPAAERKTQEMMDKLDTAMGTGKGISRIVGASLKSPMDISLALAKGFHNVPRLYGEEVRKVDRVTDLKSGLTTAGKEFGYGLFDGITGLVTQPYVGAKKEGTAGFFKGFGKGIAGLYVKPSAAAFAIPAYAMKGMYKEYTKKFGESTEAYITAARTAEGYEQWGNTTREYRIKVVHEYLKVLKDTNRKRGVPGEEGMIAVAGGVEAVEKFIEKRKVARRNNLKKLAGMTRLKGKGKKKDFREGSYDTKQLDGPDDVVSPGLEYAASFSSDPMAMQHEGLISSASMGADGVERPGSISTRGIVSPISPHRYPDHEDELYEDSTVLGEVQEEPSELEAAREPAELEGSSVPVPSQDDDAELEEAIRQSIEHSSRGNREDDMMIDRAIRASIAEFRRTQSIDIEEEEAEDEELKRVLTESARLHRETVDGPDQESGAIPANDAASGAAAEPSLNPVEENEDEEEELRKAMEESLKMDEEREKERREEEIILEYIKKTSLAEEQFRKQMMDIAEGSGSGRGSHEQS